MELSPAVKEELAAGKPTKIPTRPHYLKDINHIITKQEAIEMVSKAKNSRDRFIIAMLYLTGCRPIELVKTKAKDIMFPGDGRVVIRLSTAKLGQRKGFYLKERVLDINESSTFVDILKSYTQGLTADAFLVPISCVRIRAIVYELSNNQFCPYHFRHSRLTNLARMGWGIDQLMYWKGSSDSGSVSAYLAGKPTGGKVVLE